MFPAEEPLTPRMMPPARDSLIRRRRTLPPLGPPRGRVHPRPGIDQDRGLLLAPLRIGRRATQRHHDGQFSIRRPGAFDLPT